jgi:hypothetical protein
MAANGGWTLETLKEHFDALITSNDRRYEQRFKDSQTALDAALNAAKEAVLKAENATEKRLEGQNEFRGTLDDWQKTTMPRSEAELRMGAIEARIGELSKLIETRVAELTKLVESRVAELAKVVNSLSAERKGGREVWAWVFSGVMALVAIGSLVAAFAVKK